MSVAVRLPKASVIQERLYGEQHEKKDGTKSFRAGAKVYVIDAYWGMCNTVTVIGHHRASGRYAKLDMPVRYLENFSSEVVYSPKVLELLEEHFRSRDGFTEAYGAKLLREVPDWKEP